MAFDGEAEWRTTGRMDEGEYKTERTEERTKRRSSDRETTKEAGGRNSKPKRFRSSLASTVSETTMLIPTHDLLSENKIQSPSSSKLDELCTLGGSNVVPEVQEEGDTQPLGDGSGPRDLASFHTLLDNAKIRLNLRTMVTLSLLTETTK